MLDAISLHWSTPITNSIPPSPRAGASMVHCRGRLVLFGGAGPQASCYNSVHVFDMASKTWLDVVPARTRLGENPNDAGTETAGGGSGGGSMGGEAAHFFSPSLVEQQQGQQQQAGDSTVPSVVVVVRGPLPDERAGHTGTLVNKRLVVLGGSRGTEYLGSAYELDLDSSPTLLASYEPPAQVLTHLLSRFKFSTEFSDVCLVAKDGDRVPAHKIILAQSPAFSVMFSRHGFQEATQREIVLPNAKGKTLRQMVTYMYCGGLEDLDGFDEAVELLVYADETLLENLKERCQIILGTWLVTGEGLGPGAGMCDMKHLRVLGDLVHSLHLPLLKACLEHYLRNRDVAAGRPA
jgi:hypothetical protein